MQRSVEKMAPALQREVVIENRGKWGWQDSEADHARYLELLATSRYAMAPSGNNPNTYRISEAVESGSTPLFVRGAVEAADCYPNWAGVYGLFLPGMVRYDWIPPAPFVSLNSWDELGGFLESKANDTEDKTVELYVWYEKWRLAFLSQLNTRIRLKGT